MKQRSFPDGRDERARVIPPELDQLIDAVASNMSAAICPPMRHRVLARLRPADARGVHAWPTLLKVCFAGGPALAAIVLLLTYGHPVFESPRDAERRPIVAPVDQPRSDHAAATSEGAGVQSAANLPAADPLTIRPSTMRHSPDVRSSINPIEPLAPPPPIEMSDIATTKLQIAALVVQQLAIEEIQIALLNQERNEIPPSR